MKKNKGGEGEVAWFREWFGEEYLELYPHRDAAEAREAVELVLTETGAGAGAVALDIACGAGRHVEVLRERGLAAFGLDLSLPLLLRARENGLPVVQADMRHLPFRTGSADLVTSFFTSFGYFADPEDDASVVAGIRRVLRPGGAFCFDFLNEARVRAELLPRDEREVGGKRVVQERRLTLGGRIVEKRIEIASGDDSPPRVFFERVRLYRPAELETLLAGGGLHLGARYGSYTGARFSADSPRLLLLGHA